MMSSIASSEVSDMTAGKLPLAGAGNPVMRRLSRLRSQWDEFAQEPARRLLRWLITDNERSLISTWLAMESDERAANCPDVLVELRAPFRSAELSGEASAEAETGHDGYAAALRAELNTHLVAANLPALPDEKQCRPTSLLAACAELWRSQRGRLELLVLVLSPEEVTDIAAFGQWLTAAVAACPSELRLLVFDDATAPGLDHVEQMEPARVRSIAANLEVAALLGEVSQQAGQSESPGGRFRQRFLQMSAALTAGDLATAQRFATMAQAVAQEQKWPQLEVAVLVALGAGAMKNGQLSGALSQYRHAEQVAMAAEAGGDPLGAQLVVKTRLAMGSVLVMQGEYAQAAVLYELVAARAETAFGPLLLLECWRMASFCHQSSGSAELAIASAERGLVVAEKLDAETRAGSSLSFLGAGLQKLVANANSESQPRVQALLRRLEALLHTPSVRVSEGLVA